MVRREFAMYRWTFSGPVTHVGGIPLELELHNGGLWYEPMMFAGSGADWVDLSYDVGADAADLWRVLSAPFGLDFTDGPLVVPANGNI